MPVSVVSREDVTLDMQGYVTFAIRGTEPYQELPNFAAVEAAFVEEAGKQQGMKFGVGLALGDDRRIVVIDPWMKDWRDLTPPGTLKKDLRKWRPDYLADTVVQPMEAFADCIKACFPKQIQEGQTVNLLLPDVKSLPEALRGAFLAELETLHEFWSLNINAIGDWR